jgi:hypothetical protein
MRTLHKWYARLNGYFWQPCPVCGQPFGGHEHGVGMVNDRVVCKAPTCNYVAGHLDNQQGKPLILPYIMGMKLNDLLEQQHATGY